MSGAVLHRRAAALGAVALLAGCAAPAPVVRTVPVEVVCPEAAPPLPSVSVPADRPPDMRDWYDAFYAIQGAVRADRIEAAAYRAVWERCHDHDG